LGVLFVIMILGAACVRKLQALEHPQAAAMGDLDETGFRNLVLWLENRKIRYYTEADRKGLQDVKGKGWDDALLKYMDELGAGKPSVKGDTAKHQVADWLASYAIGMEYSDRASKLSKIIAPRLAPAAPTHAPAAAAAPAQAKESLPEIELDAESPEFVEALHKLAATLGVPEDDSAEAMVRACAGVLKRKLSAEALAKAGSSQGGGKSKRRKAFDVKDYPPGFDTGDEELNKAASLLRLLYVADLRKLQDEVNALISQMQEYTANPKTDSSLGKVGR